MTLTEEQWEAIRVISKLPMAIGCQLCHPYIMENYGSHFIVLRDMIDSSGTVEPTGGFDLEKARAADEALPYPLDANEIWVSGKGQMHINPPNAPSIFFTLSDLCEFRNLFHGQAAEIERLRAENLELQVAVFGPDGIRANQACIIADQAARISELEIEITELKADLEQSEEIKRLKDELENYGDHYACLLISKDAQIKELEGMLSIRTEELDIAHSVARSEKEMHEKELAAFARRIKELEDAHKRSGAKYAKIINELRSSVYANIPGLDVGKIGPDAETGNRDHVVGPDQMVPNGKVWQITEERKAAIDRGLQFLEWSYAKNSAHDTKEQIAVLWAMLEEDTHGKP
jgi:hypothetical protein